MSRLSTRSPQNWFSNRSVSIRELARRPSRQNIPKLPSTVHLPYTHDCSPPKHEELGNEVEGPEALPRSPSSSVDSLAVDQSGSSNDHTYATTPSPARHHAFRQLESESPTRIDSMGNNSSTLIRKPLPLNARQSSATVDATKPEDSPKPETQQPATRVTPPTNLSARGSSFKVNVPRRRSSLTVLHLDSSHFDTVDPKQGSLQHRASTLTEPGRRPSTLAETIRPVQSSTSTATPTTETQKREKLSQSLLSPPLSNSRHSSASSQAPSVNPRNSVIPAYIHLPMTFPNGPVPIPAPPLTITHYECYQSHRRVLYSRNKFNPVPCMACGEAEGEGRWKCTWCALRICGGCMAEFDVRKRDLKALLAWLEKNDVKNTKITAKEEAKEAKGGENVGEAVDNRKENVMAHKEVQRLSKVGTARPFMESR